MSTNQAYNLVICQNCHGQAVQNQTDGKITCVNCLGRGMWLQTADGKQLSYHLPEVLPVHDPANLKVKKLVFYGLTGISLGLTLASFLYLLSTNSPTLTGLLWSKGPAGLLFGLSGLVSMFCLFKVQQSASSQLSLHTLDFSSLAPSTDLKPYLNSRLLEVIQDSTVIAEKLRQEVVDETTFFFSLLDHPHILGILARMEIDNQAMHQDLKPLMQLGKATSVRAVSFDSSVRSRIYQGILEALDHNFPFVDIEDILLAYAKNPGPLEGLFKKYGVTYDALFAVSRWYARDEERSQRWRFWMQKGKGRPQGYMNKAWTALPTPFLDSFSIDLTRKAASGYASAAAFARVKEIQTITEILSRTQNNNVLLIGEPGVGKHSLLDGLALKMVEGDVPTSLNDKRLVQMDLSALVSSGESAETSIQTILSEVRQAGNVILCIPEVQTLVGTSAQALDAATVLSNALKNGEIQFISTATYADYHRYIESNAGLSSLLQVVEVSEATAEQAIEIIEERIGLIESDKKVFFTYPAIETAVRLAKRYLPEQVLPASALTLLDEAAASVHMSKQAWVYRKNIEEVIEKKTNIPIQQASSSEADTLLNLESKMHERIIGQDQAVIAISNALRKVRAGLHDGKRPISSFLFVGPTGVGKTETAKALADLYFGKAGTMIRLDMSEYQTPNSIYKLIGAPASDPNSYTEGGELTQAVREHPFSLILLDEFEKASPDVLNLFLQLFDDGRLTENTGRTVFFNNCIIIATSNAGATEILTQIQQGSTGEELHRQTIQILQSFFKPELLNRFDAVITFESLSLDQIKQVALLMLTELIDKTASQGYQISFTPEAITKIAEQGFDSTFGARPLRRYISDKVEALLARMILEKSIFPGQPLQITAEMIQ